MRITALEEYGLRCLLQLARSSQPLTIAEVSKLEGLSQAYVGKLFFMLRRSKLVTSMRGSKGGYGLAATAKEMTLARIIHSLSSIKSAKGVCEQFPGIKKECVHMQGSCSVRSVWNKIYENIWAVLNHTTLQDLLEEEEAVKLKLAKFNLISEIPITTTGGSRHVST